jgi:glycosidase
MDKTFEVYGPLHVMGNIMDSHDKIRYMAYADGDLEINDGRSSEMGWNNPPKVDNLTSYDKLKLYYAYMMTIPGLPVVYYGSEFGMTGASDPDNRRMMYFGDKLNKNEQKTFNDVTKLIKLRNNYSSLRYGDFLPVIVEHDVLGYIRSDMNNRVLVLLNKSDEEKMVTVNFPPAYGITYLFNPITEENRTIPNNKATIKVGPSGYEIYTLEK